MKLAAAVLALSALTQTLVSALNVTYDSRSLVLDGQRKLLIAGCIHYPRSTPGMWPSLLHKAKVGGIDVVQTYVFWDMHEPVRGQFDFSGRKDLFSFLRLAQSKGMHVNLRIGPYACAEWNLGGFPEWLRELPGIVFRTDNEVFKAEMERFVKYLVNELHSRRLFADQGGPIILAQIENEYGNIEANFGEAGKRYAQWAAQLALGLEQVRVPWVMCQQWDAPDPIIETCNGFYCDSYTPKEGTPKMWTENWPGWFQSWGAAFPQRPAEDVSFAVARFFARGGSFACYYMYHGGTNFERTVASGIVTSYDYDVALDEYGLEHEPKYSHLAALHAVLHQFEDVIISVEAPEAESLGSNLEAHFYSTGSKCLTFLSNINTETKTVTYKGETFELPGWSVSLVEGCEAAEFKVLYNTDEISSPELIYKMTPASKAIAPLFSEAHDGAVFVEGWFKEPLVGGVETREALKLETPLEMLNLTHDKTDYGWFITSVSGPLSNSKLCLSSVSDTVAVFVDEKLIGFDRSSDPCFSGINSDSSIVEIKLLVSVLGLPNYGAFYEQFTRGLMGDITLDNTSIKSNTWLQYAGLHGESRGVPQIDWTPGVESALYSPVTWIKASFATPRGSAPVALDLSSMGKGYAFVNGHGLGRYWNITASGSCRPCYNGGAFSTDRCEAGCGQPSQRFYHVPRDWLVHDDLNELILFDELGGNPTEIKVVLRELGQICGNVGENYPSESSVLVLECTGSKVISSIEFSSFGTPSGRCGTLELGSCHADNSIEIVESACLGQQRCQVAVSIDLFGDPCPNVTKNLAVQAKCSPAEVSIQ